MPAAPFMGAAIDPDDFIRMMTLLLLAGKTTRKKGRAQF